MPTRTTSPSPASVAAVRVTASPRRTLVGLLTVVTAAAFEALAVATVMPVVARQLHGLSLYGWAFTAFLITSIVGMVVAGQWADRDGPAPAFLTGLGVFAAGLVVAGSATSMPAFVAGRAVQGLGSGAVIVAIYVVIARVYDEAARPRVFSAISAAWVVPAIVGPAVAGTVAEHAGWRWVFVGLLPFVAAGVTLLVPALRVHGPLPGGAGAPDPGRWRTAVALAAGVALLELAAQQRRWWALGVLAVGLVLLVPALRRLLPAGALRFSRGLPAVVAFRGVLAGGFFGAEAFVPLDLQTVHHLRPSLAGLPLTLGAVGWFAGSWYQGRLPATRPRYRLVAEGLALVTVGVGGLVAVTYGAVSPWVAVACWTVAGSGMGVAMATVGVLVLELAPAREQGSHSAAVQIADALGSTVCIGLGGALLAAGQAAGMSTGGVLRIVFAVMAAVAAGGLAVSGRARPAG